MTEFEQYKLIHDFYYDDPLKDWINEDNFTDMFKEDWNALMQVVGKIEDLGYFCMINRWTSVYTGSKIERISVTTVEGNSKLINTYQAVVEFVKWYNKQSG